MFKNKKSVSSGRATTKIKDQLEKHILMISKPNRTFQIRRDEGFYLEQDINPKNSEDYVKIGYLLQKKFISRSFNMELRTIINDVYLPENFTLKLKFTGFTKIEAAYFQGKKESKNYEAFFNEPILLERLEKIAKIIDIEFILIEYNKSLNAFIIRVAPIPGSIIWIVFPPLYFKMPLKHEEMNALWETLIILRKFTMKLIRKNNWD